MGDESAAQRGEEAPTKGAGGGGGAGGSGRARVQLHARGPARTAPAQAQAQPPAPTRPRSAEAGRQACAAAGRYSCSAGGRAASRAPTAVEFMLISKCFLCLAQYSIYGTAMCHWANPSWGKQYVPTLVGSPQGKHLTSATFKFDVKYDIQSGVL